MGDKIATSLRCLLHNEMNFIIATLDTVQHAMIDSVLTYDIVTIDTVQKMPPELIPELHCGTSRPSHRVPVNTDEQGLGSEPYRFGPSSEGRYHRRLPAITQRWNDHPHRIAAAG